jgi:aspartate/tyrosine/aromatic aminotransferase
MVAMPEHLIPGRRGFPAQDPIFALNAEAQARKAAGRPVLNAALGALADDDGELVVLESVLALWRELTPAELAPYAPISGDPGFLRALVQRHWPEREAPGVACATPGGSGALAMAARNLLEPGMAVLAADPCWGPYRGLAAENGMALRLAPFPASGAALDLEAWERAAGELLASQGRLLLWLNDPCHNPTGRSLGAGDREALLELLRRLAARGPVSVVLDLAYVDYCAEPQSVRDALDQYARLGREGAVLVGACLSLSKSLTLYGARAGALVFPWSAEAPLQAALAASCRGSFSSAPRAPQSLLLRLERDGRRQQQLAREHRDWSQVLEGRAVALDRALRGQGLAGVAWMGGFFTWMPAADPQGLAALLKARDIFALPMPGGLRVGLCGLPMAEAGRFALAMKEALEFL